jgi:hypothetical protein
VGAGLAFNAAQERFTRNDLVVLNYHVHIPAPDPMVNPSVVKRREFYGVNSSPSYFFDGDSDGGGGSADNAKSIFETKVEPAIEKHLAEAPGAKIALRATVTGATVKARADVSKVASTSEKLRLQIVLAEDEVTYSGENGERFHPVVVRAMAVDAKSDQGFALKPGKGGTFEYTFDLAKAVADAKAHLENFEKVERKGEYTFRQKKHDITGDLIVVAFVQDEATKKVLQAVYLKPPAAKKATP